VNENKSVGAATAWQKFHAALEGEPGLFFGQVLAKSMGQMMALLACFTCLTLTEHLAARSKVQKTQN
jgi:hypothetical protein